MSHMESKVCNKTFDTVDYSNIKNTHYENINNCNKISSDLKLIKIDDDVNTDNINTDTINTDIHSALSENNNENRIMIFFYGIMSNINEIITTLPDQINMIKKNSLYPKIFQISHDEKIAIATTLAFLLNLYYYI